MALNIEQVLGFVPLTAAVETVKAGIPRVLPDAFYRRNPGDRVYGDKANYIKYTGTRKTSRTAPYGSPPRQIVQLPRSSQPVKLLHTIEEIPFSQELFMALRRLDEYVVQKMAQDEIQYQATNAVTRHVNLETAAVHSVYANGYIWLDSDGNLLPSSSGADLTIDFGVGANNRNQLNGIISASWATTTTDIPKQVNRIKQQAVQTSGYPLKYALYGKNVMSYLMNNDYMKYYLARNPVMNQRWLDSGQIPDGLLDLTWVPAQNAFFEDQNDANQESFPADGVTFCPDITPMTATVFEGSYPVPKSIQITGDVVSALANVDMEYGAFGFGRLDAATLNRIIGVYGDTFLPALKVPDAFFFADVTP